MVLWIKMRSSFMSSHLSSLFKYMILHVSSCNQGELSWWRHGGLMVTEPDSERSGLKPWPGTLYCVLGQDTWVLSQCLSPTRCINGYWQISCWGVTLQWTNIPSRGSRNTPSRSCYRNQGKLCIHLALVILIFVWLFLSLFSVPSSGFIMDALDYQTLPKENGSVLSVKIKWNSKDEEEDTNEQYTWRPSG